MKDSAGPLTHFLAEDHRRLERLLQRAVVCAGQVDQGVYDQFRAGLLRHIGMEEKILIPAVQRWAGGEPLSLAVKLRLDHGAIAALLMLAPTAGLIVTLRKILDEHNLGEEGLDGLYATCDKLAGGEIEVLLAKLRTAPKLSVLPHVNTPAVLDAVRRALDRAGYEYVGDWPSS
ncbi:MAG: Cation-binding protein [Candidatus Nitrospira kreftii]|uniref:Cation-binding protein n=1 Tax=Candidatus Nitrospira kreftii TaxID=2652173 RepID=A0A7S8IZP6_9BACT|nr:MAG: Cation-binding protein [Candidatus Nitrospira kreftii]